MFIRRVKSRARAIETVRRPRGGAGSAKTYALAVRDILVEAEANGVLGAAVLAALWRLPPQPVPPPGPRPAVGQDRIAD